MQELGVAELVSRAKAGETPAFEELVRRHFGIVYLVAWDVVGHREDAEEIAQETFLRVYLRLGELRDATLFGAWLRRVAQSLATDHARRDQRRGFLAPTIPIDEEALRMADESLRETLEERERQRMLEAALQSLPKAQREMLLLHYAEGWTLKAIGEQHGVDATTVGRRLARAVEALRAKVGTEPAVALGRMGSGRPAQARTLAIVTAAAALSAPAKAALAAGAHVPAVPVAAGSSKASGILSAITSFLPSGPAGVLEGALAMGKAKAVGVSAVALATLIGGGVAIKNATGGTSTAAPMAPVAMASAAPAAAGGVMGSWVTTEETDIAKKMYLVLTPDASGATARIHTDRAIGTWGTQKVSIDGSKFVADFPSGGGPGIIGKFEAQLQPNDILVGTWKEKGAAIPLTMTRIESAPPAPLPPPRKEMALTAEAMQPLVGTYAQSRQQALVIAREGSHLVITLGSLETVPMYPESPLKFFSRTIDMQIEFVPDGTGGMKQVILTEGYKEPAQVSYWRSVR